MKKKIEGWILAFCLLCSSVLVFATPVTASEKIQTSEEVLESEKIPAHAEGIRKQAESATFGYGDGEAAADKAEAPMDKAEVAADKTEAADEAEADVEIWDVSQMVWQAGGFGVLTQEESGIAAYAITQRDELKREIYEALKEQKDFLDIEKYGLTKEDRLELGLLFTEVLNDSPELFYVLSSLGIWTTGDTLWKILFHYYVFTTEQKQAFEDKLNQAAALVTPEMTDEEKALVLHDYLAQHCSYAYEEYLEGTWSTCPNVFDAYGALVNGKAVCQGYSLAYRAMLQKVGISAEMVRSGSMNHAWNAVLIDGNWYHVDVTWDDPVRNKEGRVIHNYFLLSDSELGKRKHYGWETNVQCLSDKYDNYWWKNICSQIVAENHKYYYINETNKSNEADRFVEKSGDTVTAIYDKSLGWNTYLSRQGEYFYFNVGKNLCAMKKTDSEPVVLYVYEGGSSPCGAMVYEDGMARLNTDVNTDRYITVDLREKAPVLEPDYERGILDTTSDMEYSLDQGANWMPCMDGMSFGAFGWNGKKDIQVCFRHPAAGGKFASETVSLTLAATEKQPSNAIRGKVNCPKDTETGALLQLLNGGGEVLCTATADNTGYVLENVVPGSYTLRVSKNGYVQRDYSVTINNQDMELNVEIWHIGDVNGDGRINVVDNRMVYNHISETEKLKGYAVLAGDVTQDGRINVADNRMIYNHIAGIRPLW